MTDLCVAGHFGEWMQGRIGCDGPVALVTLPCPALGVRLWHYPAAQGLRLYGVGLTAQQVRRFLTPLGLRLRGTIRMRALAQLGFGTGVSSARLVALAQLAGWRGRPLDLARACVRFEGASDPLAFAAPSRLLWASRVGDCLADLPGQPRYEILGGFWGGARWTEPQDQAFPDISDLIAPWRQARNLPDIAALASESAARCQAMRGPEGDPTPDLARDLGALGWLRAHTGCARGLIFSPGNVPSTGAETLRAAGLRHVLQFRGGA
ncbi:propanediol utilization protein [Marinovum sp. 2_MG-2023]|uniref:propanediol utilization protein n=1 Tax=unclassified Marinovum TaxID=2647166 RepID=UPI0026E160BC|nr:MULTISPECIES: propanediol utilization protein [unclassified Marinovum]MDO6732090.1 propanediol utilization protein [Marinovum sp. 2_MG-2023]MDO6781405.1 propanediol utilization protein [Marinovum sp. 1_MG-2023]